MYNIEIKEKGRKTIRIIKVNALNFSKCSYNCGGYNQTENEGFPLKCRWFGERIDNSKNPYDLFRYRCASCLEKFPCPNGLKLRHIIKTAVRKFLKMMDESIRIV